jgi:hypothetical protein
MMNLIAWIAFASPLIITSMLMMRGAAKQRANLNHLRGQSPRVDMPRHRSADTPRPGYNDRYFSSSRNRDRPASFR